MAKERLTSVKYECRDCGQQGVYVIGKESFEEWAEKTYGKGHPYQSTGFVPLLCVHCEGENKVREKTMLEEIRARLLDIRKRKAIK